MRLHRKVNASPDIINKNHHTSVKMNRKLNEKNVLFILKKTFFDEKNVSLAQSNPFIIWNKM